MKKLIPMLIVWLFAVDYLATAQTNTFPATGSAGIGTTAPNASSILEVKSTTKGMLVPRMTKTQRDAIVTPTTGLLIYQNNSTPGFYYYTGSAWTALKPSVLNKTLNNLTAPTAINQNLLPDTNNSINIGSSLLRYKDVYPTTIKFPDATTQTTAFVPYTSGTGISIAGTTINAVWTASGNNIYNNNTGNIGIGTTSPWAGSANSKSIQLSATNYPQYLLQATNAVSNNKVWRMIARDSKVFQIQTLSDAFGTEQTALQIDRNGNSITDVLFPNGNVGIGTAVPGDKMSLKGGAISFHHPINDIPYVGIDYDTTTDGMRFRSNVLNYVLNTTQMFIRRTDGFVGIGTITPAYKLDVCGTIRGKEVRVETGWCDYVFDEKYKYRSIDELEQYVKQNKHLPGIAPASEIEKDGLKLGEMNKAMMEKIEELTLYVIQLDKANKELKNEVELLKK